MAVQKDLLQGRLRSNILQPFSDAIAGRSQELFYAMGTKDSVGSDYVLGKDAGVSNPAFKKGNYTIDLDFDITVNKPTIIAGIATIDCSFRFDGSTTPSSVTVTFNLIHYDGTTETNVGTVTTSAITTDNTTLTTKLQFNVTRQLWGIGDIIRLNAIGTSAPGGAGRDVKLFFDPNTADEELKIWLPIVNLE